MRPLEGRKRKHGDRKDGYRVRNLDPMTMIVPYIMKTTPDSFVLFEDDIEISHTQDFVFEKRKGEIPGISLYHIVFAAIARTMVDIPELNRFTINRRIYSRNEIKGSMVVMKEMSKWAERSMITPRFECEDTLPDVVARINSLTNPIKQNDEENQGEHTKGLSKLEKLLCSLPNWLLKFAVKMIFFLDNHGWLPKKVIDVSPFHSSFFITNMGSIGIAPVFHHIYEIGTLSVFGAIGNKEIKYEMNRDGVVEKHMYMKLRFVIDERATDGFIYAEGFRAIKKYIQKPELLMTPPKEIKFDKIDRE